ncbi:MAG TPA: fumarylacetoacetate hydrolase family protein [Anaerolineales bacterium]|nr:fumarylacetoacetate hydrolase family protein [Anaerolineales bacterium]
MRLVTYESQKKWRAAILIDGKVVDASAAAKAADISIEGKEISNRAIVQWSRPEQSRLEQAARELARSNGLEDALLGPPIPDPDKIICLGLNYKSHAEEAGLKLPEVPMLFAKYRNALIGPTASILLPETSQEIDYEGELAVVIGKRGKNIAAENAFDHVAGYMAFHDVSARDLQFRTGQFLSGKTLDTFAPCGPSLVINEIDDPQNLDIRTWVNGETLQKSNTSYMIFNIAQTIAYISRLMTSEAGDIIATGTPEGVGFKRTPPIFLKDGDVVEVEIEKIGVLRNPVVRSA